MSHVIPIVDFEPFLRGTSQSERMETAKKLVVACKEVGFVYIRNHGVPQCEIDRAFEISKKFYDLPLEDKMKAPHPPGWAVHRGYSWPGLEKVSNALSTVDDTELTEKLREVQDYKESYEVGSENNPDMPNIWPPKDILPEWQPFVSSFYWTCFDVARNILRALALGLGLAEDTLLRPHSGHYNQLRLLHYPPIPAQLIENNKFARMPAHSDWSTITFLFQDDSGGLQVESPSEVGRFLDATPEAGTLVLNVGDLLMRWSNDFLKSTQHRVILPPHEDGTPERGRLTKSRYSIPYFVAPDPGEVIECLNLGGDSPPKYEPITQREYAAMRARMQY